MTSKQERSWMSLLRRDTEVRKAGSSYIERNVMILQKNVYIEKCRLCRNIQNRTYEVRNSPYDDLQKDRNR